MFETLETMVLRVGSRLSRSPREMQVASPTAAASVSGGSTAAVSVRAVMKHYGAIRALDDVSIELQFGEVHGIIGENGAGKSTLVGAISGSVACDSGSIVVLGKEVGRAGVGRIQARGVRILHQNPAIEPDLTVAENIALWHRGHAGRIWRGTNEIASETLAIWSEDVARQISPELRGWALSQSQRTIVALCSALAAKPRVLILDEPTEHLRGADVERLFDLLGALRAEGVAIAYISHRLKDVTRIADRVTVLRAGRSVGTFVEKLSDSEMVALITGERRSVEGAAGDSDRLRASRLLSADQEGVVLRNVRFGDGMVGEIRLGRGLIVGVTGMAGAGQEEILRQLAGLGKKNAHACRIDLGGKAGIVDTARKARRAGVHLVSGDRMMEGVFPGLTVRENGTMRALSQLSRGPLIPPRAEAGFVTQLVEKFDVRPRDIELEIESLSGGNAQKVLLGSAFDAMCTVLLLEEPVQGLDVITREHIFAMLRSKAEEGGVTVVISTTDASDLVGVADKVLVVSRGEVLTVLEGDAISEGGITEAIVMASNAGGEQNASQHGGRGWRWWQRVVRSGGDGQVAPAALLAVVIVFIAAAGQGTQSLFLSGRNVTSMLQVLLPYAFAAFGEVVVLLQGGFDLSIGPLMGLDLVIASYFFTSPIDASHVFIGAVVLVGASVGVAVVNWALIEFAKLESMIATLVTFVALEGLGLVLRPVPGGQVASSIANVLTSTAGDVPVLAIVAGLLAVIGSLIVSKALRGRELRALGSDRRAASLMGISSRKLRLGAYLVSSAFGLLGGVALMGQVAYGDPTVGVVYTLGGLSAGVIGGVSISGGIGGLVGPLLGALLLAEALSLGAFVQAGGWLPYVLSGGVTIVGVLGYSVLRKVVRSRYAT